MPYYIKKKGTGYVVCNKMTGKEYSSTPISKEKAEAQLRVLEMAYGKEKSHK